MWRRARARLGVAGLLGGAVLALGTPAPVAAENPPPARGIPWGLALLAGFPGAWLALRRTRRHA